MRIIHLCISNVKPCKSHSIQNWHLCDWLILKEVTLNPARAILVFFLTFICEMVRHCSKALRKSLWLMPAKNTPWPKQSKKIKRNIQSWHVTNILSHSIAFTFITLMISLHPFKSIGRVKDTFIDASLFICDRGAGFSCWTRCRVLYIIMSSNIDCLLNHLFMHRVIYRSSYQEYCIVLHSTLEMLNFKHLFLFSFAHKLNKKRNTCDASLNYWLSSLWWNGMNRP